MGTTQRVAHKRITVGQICDTSSLNDEPHPLAIQRISRRMLFFDIFICICLFIGIDAELQTRAEAQKAQQRSAQQVNTFRAAHAASNALSSSSSVPSTARVMPPVSVGQNNHR
jgi:hypothetical protein